MSAPSYVIVSGWWCDDSAMDRNYHGDDVIRGADFHRLWYRAVDTFTNPLKILIVDSASPVKPPLAESDPRLEVIELPENPGHPTNHTGTYSGWTASALLGLMYAGLSGADYCVYVEQDALLYGEGIVEACIEAMHKPYMFGAGDGTVHPLQQSFFIVHRRGIEPLIRHVQRLAVPDRWLSPEKKFCIAASPVLRRLPRALFTERVHYTKRSWLDRRRVRLHRKLMRMFRNFDPVPFGYGGYDHPREVNFEDPHFYFQHGSRELVDRYLHKYEKHYGKIPAHL